MSFLQQQNLSFRIFEITSVAFVTNGFCVLGRHESCDIAIPLGVTLSKKHACIEVR